MIRISHTLLLSFALTTTIHGMKKTPNIEITLSGENQSLTTNDAPRKIERKSASNPLTQATQSLLPPAQLNNSPRTITRKHSSDKLHKSNPLIKSTSSFLPSKLSRSTEKRSFSHDSAANSPLFNAAQKNDFSKMHTMLNINWSDKNGNTSFIIAASDNNKNILELLLKQPTLKPNMQNQRKMTALHCAAENSHYKIVEILIRDPRIDASIMDANRHTARELISRSNEKLRTKMFGIVSLNIRVNNIVSELQKLIDGKQISPNLTNENLYIPIQTILYKLKEVAKKESQTIELPTSATIPSWATAEFIAQMIKWRLFYNNPTAPMSSELLQQFLTEKDDNNEED